MDCGLGCGDSYVDTTPVLSRPGAAMYGVGPGGGGGSACIQSPTPTT
jgi:hypothetical protein